METVNLSSFELTKLPSSVCVSVCCVDSCGSSLGIMSLEKGNIREMFCGNRNLAP